MPRKKKQPNPEPLPEPLVEQIKTHLDHLENIQGHRRTFLTIHTDTWPQLVAEVGEHLNRDVSNTPYITIAGVECFPSEHDDAWRGGDD